MRERPRILPTRWSGLPDGEAAAGDVPAPRRVRDVLRRALEPCDGRRPDG